MSHCGSLHWFMISIYLCSVSSLHCCFSMFHYAHGSVHWCIISMSMLEIASLVVDCYIRSMCCGSWLVLSLLLGQWAWVFGWALLLSKVQVRRSPMRRLFGRRYSVPVGYCGCTLGQCIYWINICVVFCVPDISQPKDGGCRCLAYEMEIQLMVGWRPPDHAVLGDPSASPRCCEPQHLYIYGR